MERWPEVLYGMVIAIEWRREDKGFLSFFEVASLTLADLEKNFKIVKKELEKDKKIVVSARYTLTLKLVKTWPLVPEYWEGKHGNFDSWTRRKVFSDMVTEWSRETKKWWVVVTPDKRSKWAMAVPVRIETGDRDIEAFMTYSDWPVPTKAKTAGIYSLEEITGKRLS